MSLIRSKWTKPERDIHNALKGNRIKHKMHPHMEGSPDIILPDNHLAILIHGCFWHGCPSCYNEPVNNKEFWKHKKETNVLRDRKNEKLLRKDGWKVIKLWEHEIPRHDSRAFMESFLNKLREA